MGGEDHTGNFWDTPHAKTPFPDDLEGEKTTAQRGQNWKGIGTCAVDGCGEVSGEMSQVMVSREERPHFDRKRGIDWRG